jgi:transposase InsO family protein
LPTQVREEIIEYVQKTKQRSNWKLNEIVGVLGISRARYYDWLRQRGQEKIDNTIRESVCPFRALLWEKTACVSYALSHPQEGYRRLAWKMVDEDVVHLSPSSVYRILDQRDLLYRWKRSNSGASRKPPKPKRPNEVWHTDIMYLWVRGRWYFLVSVLDGYSRYIVHWELLTSMRADEVVDVIHRALEGIDGHPKIVHDNGSQFTGKEYKRIIKQFGLVDIKIRVAHPQSNGKIERFHRSVREEGIGEQELSDLYQAREVISSWVKHYNEERLHAAINYLRPHDYYYGDPKSLMAARQQKLEMARTKRKTENFRSRERILEKVQL